MNHAEFQKMYDGSYYTIIGAGGDLEEWKTGYEEMLAENGIGKPQEWLAFKGCDINTHYGLSGDNKYPDDLHFLAFPLDGLDISKLAIFKLKNNDKWFDDIVDNDKMREEKAEYED